MKKYFDSTQFKHCTKVSVRFHEVDMFGVCNNAVYISYFEHARLEYSEHLKLFPREDMFKDEHQFFVVRNEINYRAHARYNDVLTIHSRVNFIKISSYGFEHLIIKDSTKELIADGTGVLVHVLKSTGKSAPLPDDFKFKVAEFEGKSILEFVEEI